MTNLPASFAEYTEENLRQIASGQIEGNSYETAEAAFLKTLLAGCDRFIDVGANIGRYMVVANEVLSGQEILGIEANPRLRPAIQAVCDRAVAKTDNGNRISIETCAISNSEGAIDFFVSTSPTTSSIFAGGEAIETISVPAHPLDYFYRETGKTVIKMDIEGAEYRAIASARKFLRSDHTDFFMELHGWGDARIKKYPINVCNLFFANGFGGKKIAKHYWFYKAPLIERMALYTKIFPELFLKWVVYRYVKFLVPAIRRALYSSSHRSSETT